MATDVSFTNMKIPNGAFHDMINRYEVFKRRSGREPNKVYLDRGYTQYVTLERFKEMRDRWDNFIRAYRREPNYISILPPYNGRLGLWLWFADLKKVNMTRLQVRGFRDIILSSKSLEYPDEAKAFIESARSHNIKVHAWIQTLKIGKGWVDPEDEDNLKRVQKQVQEALDLGFDGIHFDYIRYPGTAAKHKDASEKIVEFIKEAKKPTKGKKAVLSAAVMPEMSVNAKYYGQDYQKMGQELDILIPMAYKGNYKETSAWIGKVTKYVKEHTKARVWTGIQGYHSDENPTPLSRADTLADVGSAIENGAEKVIIFRYGLTSLT